MSYVSLHIELQNLQSSPTKDIKLESTLQMDKFIPCALFRSDSSSVSSKDGLHWTWLFIQYGFMLSENFSRASLLKQFVYFKSCYLENRLRVITDKFRWLKVVMDC